MEPLRKTADYAVFTLLVVVVSTTIGTAIGTLLGITELEETGSVVPPMGPIGFLAATTMALLLTLPLGAFLALATAGMSRAAPAVAIKLAPLSCILPAVGWYVLFLGIPA